MNEPSTQPHYPCPDAPPNIPLSRSNFNANDKPKVYWADVPEGDYLTNQGTATNTYSYPLTWPKRHTPITVPRCVRLLTGGSDDPPLNTFSAEQYRSFAQAIKNVCTSFNKNIYFQWQVHGYPDSIVSGLALPTQFVPVYADPDTGETRLTLDTSYLDECILFGEVLQFSIVNTVTSMSNFTINDTDPNEYLGLTKAFTQDLIPYWNQQYSLMPKVKWIFQKHIDPENYVGDSLDYWQLLQAGFFNDLPDYLQDGWEIGPDFDYDMDYIESTIRDFWRL